MYLNGLRDKRLKIEKEKKRRDVESHSSASLDSHLGTAGQLSDDDRDRGGGRGGRDRR